MKQILLYILLFLCISCQENTSSQNSETNPHILFENLQESFLNKRNEKVFPTYYGGAYIKDSSLVIIAIGDTARCRKEFIKRCKGTNFVLFHCEKPQDAIRKILHYLYTFRTEKKNKDIVEKLQFRSSFMNTEKRVSVELLTFRKDEFRTTILDSPFLDFAESIVVFE